MRTVPKWVNKIHEADKVEFSSVHTICFSPDGSQLVIGAGEKVMVYDPCDGSLLQLLQAHRGAVHAVAYCQDGNKFASGSADKNVIIWTSKMEGVLKYSHSESIQCLAYNPVTFQLASCALSDFAFWSAEVKAVQKYRVSGRITSCAWSNNGQNLAIGLASGTVSIRDKTGDETQRIARDHSVWAVTFSGSTLLVGDWGDTLSFYSLQGEQVLKDRDIGISPLSLSTLGGLILVGGVGGWSVLTAEGVQVLHTPNDWVWAAQPSPSFNTLAVACQDGTLWCYQVAFSTVHGLYRERYAYRENITDVIVQQLSSGNKVRIKCHDRVQKIAIYKHRLAVQLPERVVVYEQGDAEGMLYRVKEKLSQPTECSLLVATSDALLICQDAKLSMIGGKAPKEWTVPAPIRYVKVTALALEEVLLLGLMNGQIWQVEPSRGWSRMLLQTPGSVRCLDVSAARARLAVVDEGSVCRVYSLPARRLLFTEENVSSVSWNSWCDELLCLSGAGQLSVKAGLFPAAAQPLAGSVVGFQGGRVFCLQSNSMQSIHVPLSHAVHQYLQRKMFAEAYSVACLGVTSLDWERLGHAALEELSLEVARKALQRSGSVPLLWLIDQLQERLESGENRSVCLAEVLAHRGRHGDAAKLYRAAGRDDRALDLYVDLRMFNKAQELVADSDSANMANLAQRRAQWARHVTSPRAAAEMYLAAGDVEKAATLLAESGRSDMLIELARKLDKGASGALRHVAAALAAAGEPAAAAAAYQRLHDHQKVAELAVAAGEWQRAFALAREHAECRRAVYLPHAHRMAHEGNFVEAQRAYHMAGETGMARRVFGVLVANALREERFADAGHLHAVLAAQSDADASASDAHWRRARIYHAFELAHRNAHEPFSLSQPDTLLNAARYTLSLIGDADPPPGVSMFCLYLCIAKQASVLGATALARQMLDRIVGLQIPPKFQESVELLTVKSGAAGGETAGEEVALLCWRCRRHQPPLQAAACAHCRHRLAHSLPSYEVLPLVEFRPEEGIPEEEALELLYRSPLPEGREEGGGAEVLRLDVAEPHDPFAEKAEEMEESSVVICDRSALLNLPPHCVVIVGAGDAEAGRGGGGGGGEVRYYRNMLPELPVTHCQNCRHLFYLEDWEIQLVTRGHCPFCRAPRAPAPRPGSASPPPSPDSFQ